MTTGFVYTAVFTFILNAGQPIVADDASYKTYDACMMQGEADAKLMAQEWAWAERTGHIQPFRGVTVRCEKRPAPKAGKRHASK